MKKLLVIFLSALIVLSAVTSNIFASEGVFGFTEDFESFEIGAEVDSFETSSSGGSVTVQEIASATPDNKALLIKNEKDGMYCSVTKTFDKQYDKTITISLSFFQNDVKSDNQCILEVAGEKGSLVKIVTNKGNISYEQNGDYFVPLVTNYYANVWYNIVVQLNLYDQDADVYVGKGIGADLVKESMPLLRTDRSFVSISSYTNVSPGYYVDNIDVIADPHIRSIRIDGLDSVSIPRGEEKKEYIYEASAFDRNGIKISGVTPTYSVSSVMGVTSTVENGVVKLSVGYNAVNGEKVTITAEIEGFGSTSKEITLKNQQLTSIEVTGPRRITKYRDLDTFEYKAEYLDALGNAMLVSDCVWAVSAADGETVPTCISLDSATGILTVNGSLDAYKDKRIYITAAKEGSGVVSAKFPVVMLDNATYVEDEARFDILTQYIDNIMEYGTDKYNGTPLICTAIDVETRQQAEWRYPSGEKVIISTLAEQGNLMKIMDALTAIDGDTKYSQLVEETYQHYLDNYIAENGLVYWGGHCAVDLKTGNITYAPENRYHELKCHYPYMEPFFKLDAAQAEKMIKAIWCYHMQDWNMMLFTRHGDHGATIDYTKWDTMAEKFDDGLKGVVKSRDLPFREAANDYLDLAMQLYDYTGDETALTHSYHLWTRFASCVHPDTGLGGNQFTTALGADGVKDPLKELEPIGHWWDKENMPWEYTNTQYGDRAYNQFAQEMVDRGIITEAQMEEIIEPYSALNTGVPQMIPFVDFTLADSMEDNGKIAEAKAIRTYVARMLSSYSDLAYNEATNATRPIWANGIDMTGYVVGRQGYYRNAGDKFAEISLKPRLLLAYCKTYLAISERNKLNDNGSVTNHDTGVLTDEEYQEYKDNIWFLITNALKGYGLGNIGTTEPGDNMDIDLSTTYQNEETLLSIIYLYEATGITEYLDLARKLASNMISSRYKNGFFVKSSGSKYARFASENTGAAYALLYLDAVITERQSSVPEYMPYSGYWNSDILYENDRYQWKVQDQYTVWTESRPSINVTDIYTDNTMYILKPDETVDVEVTIEPDDASSKSVYWTSSDPTVARFDENENKIYALSKGKTIITGRTSVPGIKTQIEVVVEE